MFLIIVVSTEINYGSITSIKSEPIIGHEEYSIVGLQIGKSDASTYFLYWFPTNYVDALKDEILGKFM